MHRSSAERTVSWPLRAALLFTLLLAAALRLWQLDVLPPGLFFDETFNGLDANRVLAGDQFPFFFAGNSGREPLFIYLQTLAVGIFGRTPFALRLVSAFTGIATVAVVYTTACWILGMPNGSATRDTADNLRLLGKLPSGRRLAALIAAAGLAVSFWHLSLSRLGFRVVLLPPTSALAFGFFWRAWTQGRRRDYLWAGAWLALAMYTYLAARLLPAVILLFIGVELLADLAAGRRNGAAGLAIAGWRPRWKPRLAGLAATGLVALLLLAPMLLTLLREPGLLTTRVGDVSLFTAAQTDATPAQRVAANALAAVRGFYVAGDDNLRHNLPGRSVNDWLLAALFTAGLFTALAHIKKPYARLLLIWLAVMALPAVLTTQPVHALRGVGMLPPLALLYGLGAWGLGRAGQWLLERRGAVYPRAAVELMAILWGAVILFSGATTARDYFARWGRSNDLAGYFQLDRQLAAAKTADLLADGSPVLISRGLFLQAQMGYALGRVYLENTLPDAPTGGAPVPVLAEVGFDATEPMFLVWRKGGEAHAAQVKPPSEWAFDFPEGRELRSPVSAPGWPAVKLGTVKPETTLEINAIRYPLDVEFANGIRLAGYDVEPDAAGAGLDAKTFRLHLFFQFEDPGEGAGRFTRQSKAGARLNEFDVFAHLATRDGVALTANGPISGEHLPYWLLPGSDATGGLVFEDIRRFTPPEGMAPGKGFFEAGLYAYHPAQANTTFERIAVADAAGQPIGDALTLGGVFVGPPPTGDLTGYRPSEAKFGDAIALAGWCVAGDPAADGSLRVGLAWHALDRPAGDYTAFVHLVDAEGQIVAQHDRPPGDAANPTHLWAPGETIRSDFELALPAGGAPPDARLRIGLYEPKSGGRLPVVAASGPANSADSPLSDGLLLPVEETGCP